MAPWEPGFDQARPEHIETTTGNAGLLLKAFCSPEVSKALDGAPTAAELTLARSASLHNQLLPKALFLSIVCSVLSARGKAPCSCPHVTAGGPAPITSQGSPRRHSAGPMPQPAQQHASCSNLLLVPCMGEGTPTGKLVMPMGMAAALSCRRGGHWQRVPRSHRHLPPPAHVKHKHSTQEMRETKGPAAHPCIPWPPHPGGYPDMGVCVPLHKPEPGWLWPQSPGAAYKGKPAPKPLPMHFQGSSDVPGPAVGAFHASLSQKQVDMAYIHLGSRGVGA